MGLRGSVVLMAILIVELFVIIGVVNLLRSCV